MQPKISSSHRRDLWLLIFCLAGIMSLAGRGIYVLVTGFDSFQLALTPDQVSSLLDASSMFFCVLLLIPLLIYSIRGLRGREIPEARFAPIKFWQVAVIAAGWLIIIIIGSVVNSIGNIGGLIVIPFFLLGIVIPIVALIWIAVSGLPTVSWRRLWAAFAIGMTGSTLVAVLLEYSLVALAALAAGVVAASNPEWLTIFNQIRNQVTKSGDVQALLISLAPYLANPLVLLLALAFASVIAPIIEESLKPAAVWLLGKRLQSPAEGFALGAVCGAGFAMLEGSLAASGMSQLLGIGLAARAASSLMHITASALMGWGIASARLEKRYWRLAGTFLISLGIHGVWNGSVVLAVFGSLRISLQGVTPDVLGILLVVAGIGILGTMFIAITVLLPVINRRLRSVLKGNRTPERSDIIAPLHP
jgi:hypothetical protein